METNKKMNAIKAIKKSGKKCILFFAVIQIIAMSVYADGVQLNDAQKQDLYNLKIMVGDENGDLRLNDNITRAEAAKMICTAANLTLAQNADIPPFKDVTYDHWAYKYICALKNNNITNGDESENFNPESNITNEEIVKMIVCLLGYTPIAEARGGYPAGYTAAASQIGITSDLNLKTNTPATRNDVAVMISNALDTPIMAQDDKNSGENAVYIIFDGKNGVELKTIRGTR